MIEGKSAISRRTLLQGGVGFGLAGALAVSLAGCAPAAPAPAANAALKMDTVPGGTAIWPKLFDLYKKHGGPKVTYEAVPGDWPQLVTRINAERQTGKAPDIANMSVAQIPAMVAHGQVEDLSTFGSGFSRSRFSKASIDTYTDGSHLWALPANQYTQVIFYNKTLLAKAGIAEPSADWSKPWSFEEWRAAAEATTSGDGKVYGTAVEISPERTIQYLWSNGASFLSEDLKKFEMDSPEAVDTFAFIAKLFADKLVPPQSLLTTVPVMNLFISGRAAVILNGAWAMEQAGSIKDFEWGVAPAPAGSTGQSFTPAWVDGWIMPKGVKNPKESWKALDFFESDAAWELLLSLNYGGIPPITSVLNKNKSTMFHGLSEERKQVWFNSLDHAKKYGFPANYPQIINTVNQQLALITTGSLTAAKALGGLKGPIQSLLDQNS